jgi:hypothetical protein
MLVAIGVAVLDHPQRASADTSAVNAHANSAAAYATNSGYRSSVAVFDTVTGQFWGSGDYNQAYVTESVAKIFIAAKLLVTGQMTGWVATTAYTMITQSDDASANALYGRVGGASVATWVEQYFGVPNLDAPPVPPNCWGCTPVTAQGLVYLYNALKENSAVWGWLSNAMSHATEYGSDGTYQFFGIPSATSDAAIKQGWGDDGAGRRVPDFNSTGFVNRSRFAVAILTQGPGYGTPISNIVTAEAQLLMPGGQIAGGDIDEIYADATTWHDGDTGLAQANSISAVNMGGVHALVMAVEGGVLHEIYGDATGWHDGSTGLGGISSISAVNMGGSHALVMALEGGVLHEIYGDASGWHDGNTGLAGMSSISAVKLDSGGAHARVMALEGGVLHEIYGDATGWHDGNTGLGDISFISAVDMGGAQAQVMAVEGGVLHEIYAGATAWLDGNTGLGGINSVSAVRMNAGDAHARVMAVEGGVLHEIYADATTWHDGNTGLRNVNLISAVNLGGVHSLVMSE